MVQNPAPACPKATNTAHLSVGREDAGTEQMLTLESRHSQQCTHCLGASEGTGRGSSWHVWSEDPKQHGAARGQATSGLP